MKFNKHLFFISCFCIQVIVSQSQIDRELFEDLVKTVVKKEDFLKIKSTDYKLIILNEGYQVVGLPDFKKDSYCLFVQAETQNNISVMWPIKDIEELDDCDGVDLFIIKNPDNYDFLNLQPRFNSEKKIKEKIWKEGEFALPPSVVQDQKFEKTVKKQKGYLRYWWDYLFSKQ